MEQQTLGDGEGSSIEGIGMARHQRPVVTIGTIIALVAGSILVSGGASAHDAGTGPNSSCTSWAAYSSADRISLQSSAFTVDPLISDTSGMAWSKDHSYQSDANPGGGVLWTIEDRASNEDADVAGRLNSSVSSTASQIEVNEINSPPATPFEIRIDKERMEVTQRSGSSSPFTYTVSRAVDGTDAATHNASSWVHDSLAEDEVYLWAFEEFEDGTSATASLKDGDTDDADILAKFQIDPSQLEYPPFNADPTTAGVTASPDFEGVEIDPKAGVDRIWVLDSAPKPYASDNATLLESINSTQTDFDVDDAVWRTIDEAASRVETHKLPNLPFYIRIDSETMKVTGRSFSGGTATYTVERHVDGTSAASHSVNASVKMKRDFINLYRIDEPDLSAARLGTVAQNFGSSDSQVKVTETSTPPAIPFILQYKNERMRVTARSLDTGSTYIYDVVRAVDNTAATAGTAGDNVGIMRAGLLGASEVNRYMVHLEDSAGARLSTLPATEALMNDPNTNNLFVFAKESPTDLDSDGRNEVRYWSISESSLVAADGAGDPLSNSMDYNTIEYPASRPGSTQSPPDPDKITDATFAYNGKQWGVRDGDEAFFWHRVPKQWGTSLEDINLTETKIDVTETSTPPATPFVTQIENERMNVTDRTSLGGSDWQYTVTRAYNGTAAKQHEIGDLVLQLDAGDVVIYKNVNPSIDDHETPSCAESPATDETIEKFNSSSNSSVEEGFTYGYEDPAVGSGLDSALWVNDSSSPQVDRRAEA
jgi:hypothetical protein